VEHKEVLEIALGLAEEAAEADKPLAEVDYARAGVSRALARLGRHGEAMAMAATIRNRGLRAYTFASIAEASRHAYLDAAALAEEQASSIEPPGRAYIDAKLAEAEARWGGDPLPRLRAAASLAAGLEDWRPLAKVAVAYAACGFPGMALVTADALPGPEERGFALSEAAYAMRRGNREFLEAVYRAVSAVPEGGMRYVYLSRLLAHEALLDPGLAEARAEGLVESVARMSGVDALHVQPAVVGNIYEAGLADAAAPAADAVVEALSPMVELLPFQVLENLVKVAFYYIGPREAWEVARRAGAAVGLALMASALDSWTAAWGRMPH